MQLYSQKAKIAKFNQKLEQNDLFGKVGTMTHAGRSSVWRVVPSRI